MAYLVLVGITLAVFQQFCGINVVFNYTSTIFKSVGASLDKQLFETVAIGIVNTLFTLLAMWQVDKLGRRPLMLIGSLDINNIFGFGVFIERTGRGRLGIIICAAGHWYVRHIAGARYRVIISEIFPNDIQGVASLCRHCQPVDRLFYTGIYVPGSGRTFRYFWAFLPLLGYLFFWIFIYPRKSKGNKRADIGRTGT